MVRKAFIILVVMQGACSSGPAQLDDYRPAAVDLNARFVDVPTGIIAPIMFIDSIGYCSSDSGTESEVKEVELQERDGFLPFDPEHWQVEILSSGGPYPLNLPCGGPFFRARAYLQQEQISAGSAGWSTVGTWAPIGYDLVYAPFDATFAPFGPGGATIALPAGYSWLHRTCGASPGSIAMSIVKTSETVDFHDTLQPLDNYQPPDYLAIEQSERALVEGCGATVPAQDLGLQLSFDRAQSLIWAPDGSSLYYLASVDPHDSSQSVGLRQLHLADLVASEVATVSFANNLQIDSTGHLYVGNKNNLLQVGVAADGKATLVTLPVPADAMVSPDGRWLAYMAEQMHVRDIQSGADRIAVNGSFLSWSPESNLAYIDWTTSGFTVNVLSPATLEDPTVYGPTGYFPNTHLWDIDGPSQAQVPFIWSCGGSTGYSAGCFGLSLIDLRDETQRQILDASAGKIDLVQMPPVLGFTLVWARTCLGLYNTVCTESLLRIGLADGTVQTVAVAPQAYPVAVSPDNQRIAIAAPRGIHVKSLVP